MEEVTNVNGVLRAGVKAFLSIESAKVSDVMHASVVAVSDDEVAFTIPVKDGYFHPLAVGTPLEIYFYVGSGRFFFKTKVLRRILLDNKPVLVCVMPKSFIRTERREYYRIETFFPVKIFITDLVTDQNGERIVSTPYNAHCIDISGGGMQLDTVFSRDIPLQKSMIVDIDFCEAIDGVVSRAQGIVVRVPGRHSGWGIKFTKISYSDRDNIIRYVFKKQFEAKKQAESNS